MVKIFVMSVNLRFDRPAQINHWIQQSIHTRHAANFQVNLIFISYRSEILTFNVRKCHNVTISCTFSV